MIGFNVKGLLAKSLLLISLGSGGWAFTLCPSAPSTPGLRSSWAQELSKKGLGSSVLSNLGNKGLVPATVGWGSSAKFSSFWAPGAQGLGKWALSAGSGDEEEAVFEGDVVEFETEEACTLGWVEGIEGEQLRLLPLVKREGLGDECYIDESQPAFLVPREKARWINVYPQQRVAWSMDSPHHNPHGEESEDCFVIEDTLSPNCLVPVKHISET